VDKKREDRSPGVADSRPSRTAGKKPYVKPVLTEYGSVAKLTRGSTGSVNDGGSGMMKHCL
jgi:hypothetical protein